MNDDARADIGTPAPGTDHPAALRGQVAHTRDELGQTGEALAAEADAKTDAATDATTDVKAQAKEKTAALKGQAADKAALAADQIREKAGRAAQLAEDTTPDPVLEKAGEAATAARANRTPLLAVGAAVVVFLLVRRSR